MVGPERRIDKVNVLNGDVARVGHIGEARALGILVRTLRIPLTANPELLPIVQAVAVDGAPPANGEAVETVGIDEGGEILARLALDARHEYRIVGNAL